MKGGALKRKIKNITRKYKMKGTKRRFRTLSRKIQRAMSRGMARARSASVALTRSMAGGRRHKRHTKRTRKHRGGSYQSIPYPAGYGQYQNNLPLTPTYSVGGVLGAKDLALANPPPISVLNNCTNCVDNYNHNTNSGFPSRGH